MQHPAVHLIEGYFHRTLPPADMLSVGDHLAQCPSCRSSLETMGPSGSSAHDFEPFLASDFAEHLSQHEIVDAARQIPLRPSAQEHLERCSLCRGELRDVQSSYTPSVEPVLPPPPPRANIRRFVWFVVGVFVLAIVVWKSIPKFVHKVKAAKPIIFARIHDGDHDIGLDEDGNLSGQEPMPLQYSEMLAGVLHADTMPAPSVGAGNTGRSSEPVQVGTAFDAISPRNEMTLIQPTFRWNPQPGADSYTVEVYDMLGRLVVSSPAIKDTQWTPQRAALNLASGYFWQVKATTPRGILIAPDPSLSKATFTVTDLESSTSIENAQRNFAGDPLLLAVLYAKAGMRSQAIAQLHILEKQNPDSPLVHGLVNSLP